MSFIILMLNLLSFDDHISRFDYVIFVQVLFNMQIIMFVS